jgi:LysM repeat protein
MDVNVYDEQHDGQRAFWDDEVVVTTGRRSNPFAARLAVMMVTGLVVCLLAWGVRSVSGDGASPTVPSPQPEPPTQMAPVTAAPVTAAPVTAAPVTAAPVPADAAVAQRTVVLVAQPASGGAVEQIQIAPAAKACSNPYKVVKGDGWIAIAKRAGVTTKQLLAANGATAKTKLYPDRSICLPKGASVTTAPSTTAPSTTAPAAAPAKKKKATTPAPPAAAPPTTAVQVRTYTAAEVEAIIRQVWPDDLEDKAIQIAIRESRLKPTARNWCCSGLFQIYYGVHSKWLAGIGVSSADQLLDPNVNATAAYALYQRAGSWKPWGG